MTYAEFLLTQDCVLEVPEQSSSPNPIIFITSNHKFLRTCYWNPLVLDPKRFCYTIITPIHCLKFDRFYFLCDNYHTYFYFCNQATEVYIDLCLLGKWNGGSATATVYLREFFVTPFLNFDFEYPSQLPIIAISDLFNNYSNYVCISLHVYVSVLTTSKSDDCYYELLLRANIYYISTLPLLELSEPSISRVINKFANDYCEILFCFLDNIYLSREVFNEHNSRERTGMTVPTVVSLYAHPQVLSGAYQLHWTKWPLLSLRCFWKATEYVQYHEGISGLSFIAAAWVSNAHNYISVQSPFLAERASTFNYWHLDQITTDGRKHVSFSAIIRMCDLFNSCAYIISNGGNSTALSPTWYYKMDMLLSCIHVPKTGGKCRYLTDCSVSISSTWWFKKITIAHRTHIFTVTFIFSLILVYTFMSGGNPTTLFPVRDNYPGKLMYVYMLFKNGNGITCPLSISLYRFNDGGFLALVIFHCSYLFLIRPANNRDGVFNFTSSHPYHKPCPNCVFAYDFDGPLFSII